jgi:hypothetical protein
MGAFAAIWASLESAVVGAFGLSSAYGAPALFGALAFAALSTMSGRGVRGADLRACAASFVRSSRGASFCIRRVASTCACG